MSQVFTDSGVVIVILILIYTRAEFAIVKYLPVWQP